jgi:hypothetical protein
MAASSLGEARPDVLLGLGLARRFLVFLLVAVRGGMGSTGSIACGGKRVDRSRVRVGHGSSVARPRAVVGGGGQAGPRWAPITLDPIATRVEVLKGVAYGVVVRS